jgi:flavin-dependent dehydrogenase
MDVGSVAIESPAGEMRIAALYRGNGPREGGESAWESFDGYLQNLTVEKGARVVRNLITGVDWREGFPWLRFADQSETRYDLVAVASGVNSNFLNMLDDMPVDLKPPRTTRTYICEFKSSQDELLEILGNAVHVFLLSIPRLEFAAIIPKGDFATVVMVGEDLDQELVHEFLNDPVVSACFPTGSTPCVCSCAPLINMGARKRPYGDRIVLVGDSGVTRLYKDGIGAAFRTAKAAASTAVFQGVSKQSFARNFWPACRTIANDNAIGRVMFGTTTIFKRFRFLRHVMYRMAAREQAVASRKPHMSTLLWNMFTGSAPYTEILQGAMHPGFIGNLALNFTSRLWPGGKKEKVS